MFDFSGCDGAPDGRTRSVAALECEPGVVRLFGLVDIARQGLLAGWADPEEGHLWNDGNEAALLLATRAPVSRLGLLLGVEPYVSRARPAQEVTLFGNGLRIGHWRLMQRVEVTLSAALEPEWWLSRGGGALMRLGLYLPNSTRPRDIADGPDGRELGLCLRSLCLQPLPDVLGLAAA